VVEGARLESVCRGNSTVGSNPTLSAILLRSHLILLADMMRSGRSLGEGGRIPLSPPPNQPSASTTSEMGDFTLEKESLFVSAVRVVARLRLNG
jgi:hypothetical protein